MSRLWNASRTRSKAWLVIVSLILLSGVLITQFQNCADVGVTSTFSDNTSSSVDCTEDPSDPSCLDQGVGDPSRLSLKITIPTTSVAGYTVSDQASSLEIEGTCDSARFSSNRIRWSLTNSGQQYSDSTYLDSANRLVTIRCQTNRTFRISLDLQGPTLKGVLKANQVWTFSATLYGYDSNQNLYRNPGSGATSRTSVYVRQMIPPPVLDSRFALAAGDSSPNAWTTDRPRLPFTGNYEVEVSDLGGFCKFTSGSADNEVRINYREAQEPANTTQRLGLVSFLECKPIIAGKFVESPFNGYFQIPKFKVSYMNGEFYFAQGRSNARHVIFTAEQKDTASGTWVKSPSFEAHFKFSSDQTGRGWTLPIASAVLQRVKKAIYMKDNDSQGASIPGDTDGVTVSKDEALDFILPQGGNSGTPAYGLRTKIWEYADAYETLEPVPSVTPGIIKVNSSHVSTGSLTNRFFRILSGARRCNLAVDDTQAQGFAMEVPLKKDVSLDEARKKQVAHLSICMMYWVFRTVDPNMVFSADGTKILESFFQASLREGLHIDATANSDQVITEYQRCFPLNHPDLTASEAGGVCSRIGSTYRDLTALAAQAAAAVPGLDLKKSGAQGNELLAIQRFYEGAAQSFANQLLLTITHDGHGFKHDILLETLQGTYPNIAVEPFRFFEKSRTGWPDFTYYSINDMVGSLNANGSIFNFSMD